MNKKAYIINLKFGIWENQLWLEADDDEKTLARWEDVKSGLDNVAKRCHTSGEYFTKATEYFADNGFHRIQK